MSVVELIDGDPELGYLLNSMLESPVFRTVPEHELVTHIRLVAGPGCSRLRGEALCNELKRVCRDPAGGGLNSLEVRNLVLKRIRQTGES